MKNKLIGKLWRENSDIYKILKESDDLQELRKKTL